MFVFGGDTTMKTIIYAVEVPKGIIIQGENFIIIGTGEN
jgi:hypothetical protein